MFQQLYGFQSAPFARTLNTGDVLLTPSVKELNARLTLAVREKGIALVTGEVGSGKSTAVRAFIASLDANRHALLYLTLPINSPTALYRQLLATLNQPVPFGAAAQIAALRNALAELIQSHRKTPVIVIDEAHLLPHALIDPLRTLISALLSVVEGSTASPSPPSSSSASPNSNACCNSPPMPPSPNASLTVLISSLSILRPPSPTSSIISRSPASMIIKPFSPTTPSSASQNGLRASLAKSTKSVLPRLSVGA